jgi:predicted DNA-binding ribbon-helix-helix protein
MVPHPKAAASTYISVPALVERIDHERTSCNLSSAIRVFVFHWLQQNYLTAATAQQMAALSSDLMTQEQ